MCKDNQHNIFEKLQNSSFIQGMDPYMNNIWGICDPPSHMRSLYFRHWLSCLRSLSFLITNPYAISLFWLLSKSVT